MTVYVDNMRRRAQVGRGRPAVWSHMMADTHGELMAMADEMGLDPSWLQHRGTHREHFDVTEQKRGQALGFGAVAIEYPHGTGRILAAKRAALAAPSGSTRHARSASTRTSSEAPPPSPAHPAPRQRTRGRPMASEAERLRAGARAMRAVVDDNDCHERAHREVCEHQYRSDRTAAHVALDVAAEWLTTTAAALASSSATEPESAS